MDETDVCNAALDLLRETPIAHMGEKSSVAEWFSRNYDATRRAVLRAYPWNFAIKRAALTADATTPDFGWFYRYEMPSDLVRMLPIRSQGLLDGAPIQYEIEGAFILTNNGAPLQIRYVADIDEVDAWDALFVRALSAKMALDLSHWLTGKASYVQVAKALFDEAMSEARRIDAMEGTPETVNAEDVIAVRSAR